MQKIKFYQVDAFTGSLFGGNPAGVCLPEQKLDETLMQSIAAENNLSETAFVTRTGKEFGIRWFTPAVEVDLCGHATLASAFVIFNHTDFHDAEIHFNSPRSGELIVRKVGTKLYLDFPVDEFSQCPDMPEITMAINVAPLELYRGKTDYMAVLGSEEDVLKVDPDYKLLEKLDVRGLIITARGNSVDFVSRFFAPQSGVNEDPVTGSAHTTLVPYWSAKLHKTKLNARQISVRGGSLDCQYLPPRVIIGGEAQLYLVGEIMI